MNPTNEPQPDRIFIEPLSPHRPLSRLYNHRGIAAERVNDESVEYARVRPASPEVKQVAREIVDEFESLRTSQSLIDVEVSYGHLTSRIAAAITAAEGRQRDWLPIELAPKDGSWQVVARFDNNGARLWWERAVYSLKHDSWKTYGGYCDPTHFLPLPAKE